MVKIMTSAKNIRKINEFLELNMHLSYDGVDKLTHNVMRAWLLEKGHTVPSRVNFKDVKNEDILNGNYVIVKDVIGKRMVYRNPLRSSIDSLLGQLHTEGDLEQIRSQILAEQGYQYDCYGRVVEVEEEIPVDEDFMVSENFNRQKIMIKMNYHNPKRYMKGRR